MAGVERRGCWAGTSRADLAGWGDLLESRGATEEKRQAPGHTGDGEAKFRGFLAPAGRLNAAAVNVSGHVPNTGAQHDSTAAAALALVF